MAVKGAGRRVEIGGEERVELERIARAVSGEVRRLSGRGSCWQRVRG
jgi:hypothetical protein